MNSYFLKKAKALTPKLNHTFIEHPDRELIMKPGDEHLYDFGNHYTGYVTLKLDCTNPADAPAFLKLTFAEDKEELGFNSADYNGWLSRSWIQEETVHFDLMPKSYRLPRRYAFRYLKVEVISISPLYLITDHTGFYERYGWEFFCMVQGSDPEPSRMYVHY